MAGFFKKLVAGLTKTKAQFTTGLKELFGRKISAETLDELEELLILSDLGVEATTKIVEDLRVGHRRRPRAGGKPARGPGAARKQGQRQQGRAAGQETPWRGPRTQSHFSSSNKEWKSSSTDLSSSFCWLMSLETALVRSSLSPQASSRS